MRERRGGSPGAAGGGLRECRLWARRFAGSGAGESGRRWIPRPSPPRAGFSRDRLPCCRDDRRKGNGAVALKFPRRAPIVGVYTKSPRGKELPDDQTMVRILDV